MKTVLSPTISMMNGCSIVRDLNAISFPTIVEKRGIQAILLSRFKLKFKHFLEKLPFINITSICETLSSCHLPDIKKSRWDKTWKLGWRNSKHMKHRRRHCKVFKRWIWQNQNSKKWRTEWTRSRIHVSKKNSLVWNTHWNSNKTSSGNNFFLN